LGCAKLRLVIPGRPHRVRAKARPDGRLRAEPGIQKRGENRLSYFVYLLASRKDGTLYLGVTRDLVRRTYEHRTKVAPGFTSRYDIRRLVWFETYDDPATAIAREKQLKKWQRAWKIELIEKENPDWRDLYEKIVR
jgi:putative endonuclease